MKAALIGPELEENLGLGYLHSSLETKGHQAQIFDFHTRTQIPQIVTEVIGFAPELVGLSMVYTARAREFVDLAAALRRAGFNGHITAGGHFASFHAQELLNRFSAFDSIVHGEGEETIVDLIEYLEEPQPVSGITYRDENGALLTTSPRANPDDLDSRPFPSRQAHFQKYLGLPVANMLGSRGCYGRCRYCSITAWYKQNPGRQFRQRSVEKIAKEMAGLYHQMRVRIFNFHDDNFFLPSTSGTVKRFAALHSRLQAEGLGRIALQLKARPDSIEKEPISVLKEMGLFRVFLGVETNSPAGLETLGRGTTTQQNHRALQLLQDFDLHVTFNLLMFDPETMLSDIRDNIAFMRQYSHMPLNFCRTEVYTGTPLEHMLRKQNRLRGDLFGYSYTISDQRAQQAFDLFRQIFWPRNFDADGMNLEAMRLDYHFHLLKHFQPHRVYTGLAREVKDTIQRLNRNSAELLSQICDFVSCPPTRDTAALNTFAQDLTALREDCDETLRMEMQALLQTIKNRAINTKSIANTSKAAAASAAAALVMMTMAGCDERPGRPPAPTGSPGTDQQIVSPEQWVPELSQEEAAAVNAHVRRVYYVGFLNSLRRNKVVRSRNIQVKVDLNLDSSGRVTSFDIHTPKDLTSDAFEREFAEQIRKWVFPSINRQGHCQVTLEYDRGWMEGGMGALPPETDRPKAAER
jgi:radical SAM superfamily enzyme YgiQ (UPF0313 family)